MTLAVVAVCSLLVAAGAILAFRWGGLDVERPWPSDVPAASIAEQLRRALWGIAVHVDAAILTGLLVVGPGGRLVMRLLAATSSDAIQGRVTEAGETVGEVTVDGTIGLVLFAGLFGGLLLAAMHGVLGKWLPRRRAGALVVCAAFAVTVATRLDPLRPDNVDFIILGRPAFAVASFVVVGVLACLTLTATIARLSHALPLLAARPGAVVGYVPILLVLPLGVFALAAAVVVAAAVALLRRPWFRAWWDGRAVLVAGRAALVVGILAFLPAFVADVAHILD